MYSVQDDGALPPPGFPIRASPDRSLFSGSPKLIAAIHALLRLLTPRHPPHALSSLTTISAYSQIGWVAAKVQIEKIQPKPLTKRLTSLVKDVFTEIFSFQRSSWSFEQNATDSSQNPTALYACGADRDRTDDLRNANPALSQLSYSPR